MFSRRHTHSKQLNEMTKEKLKWNRSTTHTHTHKTRDEMTFDVILCIHLATPFSWRWRKVFVYLFQKWIEKKNAPTRCLLAGLKDDDAFGLSIYGLKTQKLFENAMKLKTCTRSIHSWPLNFRRSFHLVGWFLRIRRPLKRSVLESLKLRRCLFCCTNNFYFNGGDDGNRNERNDAPVCMQHCKQPITLITWFICLLLWSNLQIVNDNCLFSL